MSKQDHEIILTLTPFEASVILVVLMQSVHWLSSGKLGDAARDIYAALSDVAVEAEWSPKDPQPDERGVWRKWEPDHE